MNLYKHACGESGRKKNSLLKGSNFWQDQLGVKQGDGSKDTLEENQRLIIINYD